MWKDQLLLYQLRSTSGHSWRTVSTGGSLVGRHLVRMLVLWMLMGVWVLVRGRLLLQRLLLHCLSRHRRWLLGHHAAGWPLAHLLTNTL